MTIYSIFNDLTWTDPPTHLSKGGSVSTNHKSSNRIELSRLDQVLLKILWFHIFRPTNPPIHPPKKTATHGLGILHRFQIFKWSRNISIRSRLIAFLLIWRGHPSRTCAHACARMCAHRCMHVKHDEHGCLHVGGHLQFSNIFILAFRASACVHMHVHVSRDTPYAPQPICPLPRGAGSPNHQKFICPELIEIIRFCLKNLYLWTFLSSSRLTLITLDNPHPPALPPWSRRSRNLKNAIKRERMKIIEFCLKICDPWALLHTYRLDLMCRWGGGGGCPIPNGTFMFRAQKSTCFSLLRLPR